MDPTKEREVINFLREWLPTEVIDSYRELIESQPDDWQDDPHFQGGIAVKHLFEGNGITARSLGVPSLESIWPDILRKAVCTPESTADRSQSGG